jgi:hypothetical protein
MVEPQVEHDPAPAADGFGCPDRSQLRSQRAFVIVLIAVDSDIDTVPIQRRGECHPLRFAQRQRKARRVAQHGVPIARRARADNHDRAERKRIGCGRHGRDLLDHAVIEPDRQVNAVSVRPDRLQQGRAFQYRRAVGPRMLGGAAEIGAQFRHGLLDRPAIDR